MNLEETRKTLAAHPDEWVTLTVPFRVGRLLWSTVRDFPLFASLYDLRVDVQEGSGFFIRTFVVTLDGSTTNVLRFLDNKVVGVVDG